MQFSRLHNEHNIALQQFAEEKEVSLLYHKETTPAQFPPEQANNEEFD